MANQASRHIVFLISPIVSTLKLQGLPKSMSLCNSLPTVPSCLAPRVFSTILTAVFCKVPGFPMFPMLDHGSESYSLESTRGTLLWFSRSLAQVILSRSLLFPISGTRREKAKAKEMQDQHQPF